ncbi:hypothetical protein [Pedobacter sp.]|uniref:hypothetical protein n=1 Tax=Pedobacter sp. TaxID=1411316 RepID=UPI003BABD175
MKLIAICNRWLHRFPTDIDSYYIRGIYAERAGELTSATTDFMLVLESLNRTPFDMAESRDKKLIDEAIAIALVYFGANDIDKAIAIIEKIKVNYANNSKVISANEIISVRTRDEYLNQYIAERSKRFAKRNK